MFDRFLELLDAVPVPDDAEFLYDESTPGGALRRRNLLSCFETLQRAGSRLLLVGEAPGWRGATITGIPFMSVRELEARPGLLTGAPEGEGFEVPPDPAALWEASSRVVWKTLSGWSGPVPVSWPVYPHHPFVAGDRHTNRTPRPAEVRAGAPVVLELIRALGDPRVVAVGRKAQGALAAAGVAAEAVRHPAQGGAALFEQQVRALDVDPTERENGPGLA
ncbi:hypothetical protein GCM10025867_44480 [Frondihabitans sucicola]|uniref:Uracil-DNA glycosylase-like domain-containing protein n=1 Tax=Frondihabitans sucicola TaxID=1268041 RepID=A0ABM8GV26_9MICO|nr:uracil-DNA glycosylase [Frondihabitans sucicola]BDZ52207.1 hypothetical protein GCM10025867_44480 [Frondihabitans sucicola]